MPVKDPTAGFICYRRKVLETIHLERIRFVGYAFQIEMKYAAYSLGFKVQEVPITFKDREKGQSKMSLNIIREAMLGVLQMRFRRYGKKGF
jgi:dolichol-phosphate mannosyltransferase